VRARVILAGGLVAALAGILLAWGPPLLVVTNEGQSVAYPWFRAVGAALVAAGLVAAAVAVRSRPGRVLLVLAALAALGPLVFLARYRLQVDAKGIRQRVWIAEDNVFWSQVLQIDPRPDGVVVRRPDAPPMWIDTVGMRPSDRAVLDRGIARRLTESFAPTAAGR
jgi:hypothetical protein